MSVSGLQSVELAQILKVVAAMNTQMFESHPASSEVDSNALVSAITTLNECGAVCTSCADACLAEQEVEKLRHCIRLDLDCADICFTTASVLTRQTEPDWTVVRAQVEACARTCSACAQECEKHASMHDHCRICAEHCRKCETTCNELLNMLPSA